LKSILIIFLFLHFVSNAQIIGNSLNNNIRFTTNTEIIKRNEKVITNSIPPETDVNVAVNPINKNNLIMVSIQHRLNNQNDAFLIPIFYTLDNGRNWNRSQFRLLPREDYRVFLNGSEPTIGFTQEGDAILSWVVTFADQKFPGVDSVYHQIIYAFSSDGGASWEENQSNILVSEQNLRNPAAVFQGRRYEYQSLQILNDSLFNNDFLIFLKQDLVSQEESTLEVYNINDRALERIYSGELIFSESSQITNLDCILDERGNFDCVYLAFDSTLNISYSKFNIFNDILINQERISNITFRGGFSFPGIILQNHLGLNGEYFTPTPKLTQDSDYLHFVWNATGIDTNSFVHNIYYSNLEKNDRIISRPVIVNQNITGFQFNPNLKINDNRLFLTYFEKKNQLNPEEVDVILAYTKFNQNDFEGFINLNYKASDYTFAGDRNFGYGIGRNKGLLINDNQIFQFWQDGRTNDGNLEVYN
jgi:hypothetical protein